NKVSDLILIAIEKLFNEFREIDGIIFRIGESDGVDVKGDFKSKIYIKSPREANVLLKKMLPIFEKNNKLLIFRTWTLGAYKCGDLMWNEKTFLKIFGNIKSPNLIISLKYGNADFFRYLKLNKLFSLTDHKKIIELQTRREYEGFGEYPSFVGFDYFRYYKELENNKNIVGIYVWCQTGGWTSFKSFTFLKNTSFWNELNTYVTVKIFKDKSDLKSILRPFFYKYFDKDNFNLFYKFLKYSDYVIKNLLYDSEFAKQEIYFNKVRIPPLLYAFWDNVTINSSIIDLINTFVEYKVNSLHRSFKALNFIRKMGQISKIIGLPYKFNFHYDTFEIIYYCKKLLYLNNKKDIITKINSLLNQYNNKYEDKYNFNINSNSIKENFLLKFVIKILFRKKENYRFIDWLIFNRFVSFFILVYIKLNKKMFPQFVNNQGMPLDIFFK
ncbi:MAG TPA: glycosyl hydrolase family 67, partial [Spirochaetota bacterium]|nr:glycosyl hydrolase family 67 [Spirochaetota bacterium]